MRLDGKEMAAALEVAYNRVGRVVDGLADGDYMRPTRCAGWVVSDLLYHMLLDAQRALVAFASPASSAPDVDFATYWRPFSATDESSVSAARFVRIAASAYASPASLVRRWNETAAAAARAAHSAADSGPITTQGHVLEVPDFIATLVVEATIHHLDLIWELATAPPPDSEPLQVVRLTLDGLMNGDAPATWDDTTYALKATGRLPLDHNDRAALGNLARTLPLFS